MPEEDVIRHSHQYAVEAARCSIVADAWQPASRLLLTEDHGWSTQTQPGLSAVATADQTPQTEDGQSSFATRLKPLLQRSDLKQMQIVDFCMQSLQQDLGFSRVCVMLLSRDQSWLQNRMAIGIDEGSALANVRIDRSG